MRIAVGNFVGSVLLATALHATEFHVATSGEDASPGTQAAPLRTVQRAADCAQAGDVITVHQGVYREWIKPPRGGDSDTNRIVYQAAAGEQVEIKGSEVVKNWVKVQDHTWKVTLPNSFFGSFNPYRDVLKGDWFEPQGREHHTGAVYLNGQWLAEAAQLADVLKPVGRDAQWFGQVDNENTTIWAQFNGVDPNEQRVEINVRRTVFYPDQIGINYITVRGFNLRHAATPWAPPTAEQIGLIGTHWSRGWIIEENVISHSICAGIALGKYGDAWDNTSANTAEGYVKTIGRALASGWDKATIGHHVVRNNTICHCEQAGIVGSLGAVFSTVTGNDIHDIHVRKLFSGAEMAGIKLHAAIDCEISRNHIYRTCRGLWLDWMAQGTRVSRNLFHDNAAEDLFVEVNHGPFLVDNNLFLSPVNLLDMSEGGAYVHNLLTGRIVSRPEPQRSTPYHRAHSTALGGLADIKGGDNRFYNNILIGPGESGAAAKESGRQEHRHAAEFGLCVYDERELPLQTGGNVYYGGARPYGKETHAMVQPGFDPQVKLVTEGEQLYLSLILDPAAQSPNARLVTTDRLGRAAISELPYELADGTPIRINTDYFGQHRDELRPTSGPFQVPTAGLLRLKVWAEPGAESVRSRSAAPGPSSGLRPPSPRRGEGSCEGALHTHPDHRMTHTQTIE